MAVSQIEEKILGRLAKQTAPSNALLSASLYQVLGLSILLSRKLCRARKLRKLDASRDTKSSRLYHHIIWLAREGLSITEVYILPYCQDGEQGAECRVMAAKLRASLYHVFCLFHNHPPISQVSTRSPETGSPPSSKSSNTPRANTKTGSPPDITAHPVVQAGRRRAGKAPLRDPVPSMQSDVSFVTNPYAVGTGQTPPPGLPTLPPAEGARRTPSRPPGLAPIHIGAAQSAASFLLPPLNFVPMAKEHFETAQALATNLLSTTHALRLSVSLEHSAFLWDCAKNHDRARKLARRTIKEVYSSQEGLDDDEFEDASALVQALGGIVRRGSAESTPRPGASAVTSPTSPNQRTPRQAPAVSRVPIDRTIAVSPQQQRGPPQRHGQASNIAHQSHIPRIFMRTPERLSTVPEAEGELTDAGQTTLSPPVSRLSSRSRQRRTSSVTSAASDKASKRKLVEQAEEEKVRERQRSTSNASQANASSSRRGNGRSTSQSGSRPRDRNGSTENLATRSGVRSSRRGSPAQSNNSRQGSGTEGSSHSRQATPTEGTMRPLLERASAVLHTPSIHQPTSSIDVPGHTIEMDAGVGNLPRQANLTSNRKPSFVAEDRREAIRRTLQIISAVSKGLYVPASAQAQKQWRLL
ncbi:hypothetical protein AC579_3745 [Pseudocercospora musae]|uniref:14-3-3 domain-containing protein n=1 Tax=Pseudocercospora musae TaxID=113226 RepID=A0A139INH5_9PEZI|nr:hypothetical protein AC579_3745 [Pseudocercospora musae]